MFEKKNLLGVGITNAGKQEILEYITRGLVNDKKKHLIVTLNPEILVLANGNSDYRKILNSADLALIDGIGVRIAGKILGKNFKERTTGVDLLENLCSVVAKKPITVGFLGGGPRIAEMTAECLQKKYPGLKVSFIREEWREEEKKGADILFVAFGAPKQEFWISENLEKIPVKIAIGVGGAFDYISGKIPRAPLFVRNIGLEWLFRLIVQPWRLNRQLSLLEFIWLVFREKIKQK